MSIEQQKAEHTKAFRKVVTNIPTKDVAAAFAMAMKQPESVWMKRSKELMAATYGYEQTVRPGSIDLDLLQRRAWARQLGSETWKETQ